MIRTLAKKLLQLPQIQGKPFRPVIVSDIDGVLVRGNNPIPGTLQAMTEINNRQIPFACLTNGGGQLESFKTNKLNMIFNAQLFKPQYMFMNHTPLKPELIRYSQEPGNILLSGSLNVKQILEDLGIKNYVTADELYAIYMGGHEIEHQNRHHWRHPGDKNYEIHMRQEHYKREVAKRAVQSRLGRRISDHFKDQILEVNSVFALNDVSPYQTTLQVIHNLLAIRKSVNLPKIHYFAAQNDIIWAGGYNVPRMAFGPFNYILENHCQRHGFQMMEHIYYGKPEEKAFSFVEQQMRKVVPDGVFFMMGDNPRADIKGANNVGWYSFLTRTGIHPSPDNDKENPATFVVEDFSQAVDILLTAIDLVNNQGIL